MIPLRTATACPGFHPSGDPAGAIRSAAVLLAVLLAVTGWSGSEIQGLKDIVPLLVGLSLPPDQYCVDLGKAEHSGRHQKLKETI